MHLGEVLARLKARRVVRRPAAARRDATTTSPAPFGEQQRHEAAERVADDVRGLEAGLVHRPLDLVGHP